MESKDVDVDDISKVSKYGSIYELLGDNPGLDIDANLAKLDVTWKEDKFMEENECGEGFNRYYEISDECTTADPGIADVTVSLIQEISIKKETIEVSGTLKPLTYDMCDDSYGELPAAYTTIEQLVANGLVLETGMDPNDIILTSEDKEDDEYPMHYIREYTLAYKDCPDVKVVVPQEIKPLDGIVWCYSIWVEEGGLEIESCGEFEDMIPTTKSGIVSFIEGFELYDWGTSHSNYMTFNVPPFNNLGGTTTAEVNIIPDATEDDVCRETNWVEFVFNYQYKGYTYKTYVEANIEMKRPWEDDEKPVYQEYELENDTIWDCMQLTCLPDELKTIEDFAEYDIIIKSRCNKNETLDIVCNVEKTEDNECEKHYKRTYTIKDKCESTFKIATVTHTIVAKNNPLEVSGTLEAITYDACDETGGKFRY